MSAARLDRAAAGVEPAAAVILEPVQGEGGFLPMPTEFIQGVHAICQEHGILYISDEVQAGMGRTGRFLAIEHDGERMVAMFRGNPRNRDNTRIVGHNVIKSRFATERATWCILHT